mmetsp:Transcript_12494/g.25082  ORF Transcript_12494/g.25082 Transcript_12494/m.25082 type:complete len:243 (-) Transcript_12494:1448-2176(-)
MLRRRQPAMRSLPEPCPRSAASASAWRGVGHPRHCCGLPAASGVAEMNPATTAAPTPTTPQMSARTAATKMVTRTRTARTMRTMRTTRTTRMRTTKMTTLASKRLRTRRAVTMAKGKTVWSPARSRRSALGEPCDLLSRVASACWPNASPASRILHTGRAMTKPTTSPSHKGCMCPAGCGIASLSTSESASSGSVGCTRNRWAASSATTWGSARLCRSSACLQRCTTRRLVAPASWSPQLRF